MPEQYYTVSGDRQYRNLWFLGFERYRIERNGQLWSKTTGRWIKLKMNVRKDGYVYATLRSKNGPNAIYLIHRLVLLAFVGPCPEGMEGCHQDGNPSNNCVENLRWGTRKDNVADAIKHRTFRFLKPKFGEDHPQSRFTENDVREIRRLHATGTITQVALAKKFGTAQPVISRIVKKLNWKHVCP